MVKPTIQPTKAQATKKKGIQMLRGMNLINKVKTDKEFREQVLQHTANRLVTKYGSIADVTYLGEQESGKSFRIGFNGKESPSKFCIRPEKVNGKSGYVFAKAMFRQI